MSIVLQENILSQLCITGKLKPISANGLNPCAVDRHSYDMDSIELSITIFNPVILAFNRPLKY